MAKRDFLTDIEAVFGKGSVTSGYRSQSEQDALVAAGKTKAKHSTHTAGTGFDLSIGAGKSENEVRDRLAAGGLPVKRVIRESGKGRNQGTGAHYHIELDSGVTPVAVPPSNAAATATGGADPLNLDLVTPVVNPYTAAPELKAAHGDVLDSTAGALEVFGTASAELQAIQDRREAGLAQANKEMTAVRDVVKADTERLSAQTIPLFAQIHAVQERKRELAAMPFFKRQLAGIFNRNYNEDHLNQVESLATESVQSIGLEYNITTTLKDRLERIIATKYEGEDQFQKLLAEGATLDMNIARDHVQIATQRFNSVAQGFSANDAVLQSQANAADAALNLVEEADLNGLIAKAKQDPNNVTMVNGASLSVTQLETRSRQLEGQRLSLQAQRAAAATQDLQRKDAAESNLIAHMSPTELKTAAANGGVHKGVPLDVNKLNQAFTNAVHMEQQAAGVAIQAADGKSLGAEIRNWDTETQVTARRLITLSGPNSNKPYAAMIEKNTARLAVIGGILNKAPPETREVLKARFLPEITKMREEQMASVDSIVKGYSRNPDAQETIRSWVLGTEQTPEARTRGLIALTAGGALPPGILANTSAGRAIAAAGKAQQEFLADEQAKPRSERLTGAQFQRGLMAAVDKAAGDTWVNEVNNQIWRSLPAMALADGHPAGKIRPMDFVRSQYAGDESGYERYAQEHGMSVSDVKLMFKAGESGAQWKAFSAKNKISFSDATNDLDRFQRSAFIRILDSSPSAQPGFRPSQALSDYMQQPGLHGRVAEMSRSAGQAGFGEALADGISRGKLGESMKNYANEFSRSATQHDIDDQIIQNKQGNSYTRNPVTRVNMILSGIKGLSGQDRALLVGALQDGGILRPDADRDTVSAAIMSAKFQDPNLNRIQKIAAKEWVDMAERTDRIMDAWEVGPSRRGGMD